MSHIEIWAYGRTEGAVFQPNPGNRAKPPTERKIMNGTLPAELDILSKEIK